MMHNFSFCSAFANFLLKFMGILGLSFIGIFFLESSLLRRIYYRLENQFRSPVKLPPDSERKKVELPNEGYTISVEMALNSRCTSDYDGNTRRAHWGMFDETKKLSDGQIEKIINLARINRFTNQKVEIQSKHNILYFVVDNHASDFLRDWMMVESGMQQQAIGLACAALGIGMVFRSFGNNGVPISEADYGTTRIILDAMKQSYDGSFWSSSPLARKKPWRRGNLPDPIRDGSKPLISALEKLKIEKRNGRKATDESVSQLLWATRGRTPHYYKSRPWGMTIPSSHGEQNISSVYLISDYRLSRYSNWRRNRPTHSLEVLGEIDVDLHNKLKELFPLHNFFILLGKNENFSRALWEVGYQLLNLLIQAHALDLTYKAILLDENQRKIFQGIGIKDSVSVFLLNG